MAINLIDCMLQNSATWPLEYPCILGGDVGVVVEIGSSITSFQKGDRVVGYGVGSYIDASGKHFLATKVALSAVFCLTRQFDITNRKLHVFRSRVSASFMLAYCRVRHVSERFPGTLIPIREFKVRGPGLAGLGRVIKCSV